MRMFSPVELGELQKRWDVVYQEDERSLDNSTDSEVNRLPTVAHKLTGLSYSGGGIRSATVNLGLNPGA